MYLLTVRGDFDLFIRWLCRCKMWWHDSFSPFFFFWMVLFVYLFHWASHTDFSEDGDCCNDSRIPATSDKAVVLHLNISWSLGTYQGLQANICAERCPETNGTKGISISAGSLCTIDRDLDDDSCQRERQLLTEWCHFITARKCMRDLQYSSGRHEEIPVSHPWLLVLSHLVLTRLENIIVGCC